MKDSHHTLNLLLRWVVALEIIIYFGAALLHIGARIPLGPWMAAVNEAIPPATVVETVLGLVVVKNFVALMRGRDWWKLTLRIHLFLLAGVLLGMVSLAMRISGPPSADWNLHYIMLAGIAAAMALLMLLRKSKS